MAPSTKKAASANKTAAEVVKAVDLAPAAFGGAEGKDALAAVAEGKPDDLQYDLRHLAALDSHPVRMRTIDGGGCGVGDSSTCSAVSDPYPGSIVDTSAPIPHIHPSII